MRKPISLALLGLALPAQSYYTMTAYAPNSPEIHGEVINARNAAFIIGAPKPSTRCGLDDSTQCPSGELTLINENMTLLASEVPGGQFIYIAPDGSISYPQAHSSFRPPNSQIGGFLPYQILTDCGTPLTILKWESKDGRYGLWACPTKQGRPLAEEAVLKASTLNFVNNGCVAVEGIQIRDAGDGWGTWAYT